MRRASRTADGRGGFRFVIDAQLAAATRAAAANRGLPIWRVFEDAIGLGIEYLPPVADALPEYAYSHTKVRGRTRAALFVYADPDVVDALRAAASARDAHLWWVIEQALQHGLPLLPPPTRVPVLDYDEELRHSA